MFAKVDKESCKVISEVLCNFCKESDQKISLEKSRIYFSPNVDLEVREEVCERFPSHNKHWQISRISNQA